MARFTVKPSSKTSVKAAYVSVPRSDRYSCEQAFDELVDQLGESTVLDELSRWLSTSDLADFVESTCTDYDIVLDGYTEDDEDEDVE